MFEVYYRTRKGSFVIRKDEKDEAENLRNYIKSFGGMSRSGMEFLGLAEDGEPINEKPVYKERNPEPKKEVWGKPPLKSTKEKAGNQKKYRSPTLQDQYKIEWGRIKE